MSEVSVFDHEMLLFIDETGCDRRNAMRRFGYSIGKPAFSHSLLIRGKRFSAIGIISVNGMLDAYVTSDSVNGDTLSTVV